MVGYQHIPPSVLCNADATASALSAARQSMTLLANSAGVLPLDSRKPLALALLGPHGNATQVMMGGKNDYYAGNIVSIAAGLTALGVPPQSVVQGCDVRLGTESKIERVVNGKNQKKRRDRYGATASLTCLPNRQTTSHTAGHLERQVGLCGSSGCSAES